MPWTKEQEEAIYKRGTNILVSAGAGSGKTAVLSERVLEFVKAGGSVADLLVLTFTKAAALEMKERIYKKLKSNNYDLEANLTLSSDITTFDAYSLSIVKKYAYLLGLDSNIGIADQNVINKEIEKIITELFDSYYEINKEDFLNFLIHQNVKDDKGIIKACLDLNLRLDLLVDPISYLNEYESKYFKSDFVNKVVNDYTNLVKKEYESILNDLSYFKDELDEDNIKIINYLESYLSEASYIKNYSDINNSVNNFKMPALKKGTDKIISEKKTKIAKVVKDFKDKYFALYNSEEDIKEDIIKQREDILFLVNLNKEIIYKINEYKRKYLYFTYSDIAKMAIKLVKEYKEVRDDLSHLKEILVDEYQDTSDLQETFLSYIVKDNLYMVGDIKQSIYRFRNANPYIFKNKYERFSHNNGGIKIDLLKNFRSRKEVLTGINLIFNNLMTNELGDSNYQKDGQMNFGLTAYDTYFEGKYDTEVLSYEYPKNFEFKKAEVEAFICANKVKELVGKTRVFKGDKLEVTKYSDIAIIIDKSTNFSLFKKIFEYEGIPLTIEKDLDIKDNTLTKTLIALLGVIKGIYLRQYDNEFKRSLVSVLRSFIYSYSDEKIYNIIANNDFDIPLINKLKEIDLSLDSFNIYYEALAKLDIYNKLPYIANLNSSLVIIDYIANMLINYNKLGYDFIASVTFLNDIILSDENLTYKSTSNSSNEVKIMTIHHSKGLEYPYCIFPLLDTKMNLDDNKKKFNISNDYGFYIKKSVSNNDNSAISILDNELEKQKAISERVRLLYVALTRAREKMILVLNKEEEKNLRINNLTTFKKMLDYSNVLNKYKINVNLDDLNLTSDYNVYKVNDLINKKGIILNYSISNHHSNLLNKGQISKETSNLINKETRYLLDLGTSIHESLASIDLKNPNYKNVKLEHQKYIKNILNMPLFKDINKAKIYQEQEFYYEINNTSYSGIMDLLLEYDDHFDLIDYKLSNLDKEEYLRQLKVYRDYIKLISDKEVKVYLLSILKQEVKEITNEL